MLRHEHVLGDERAAPGAAQSGDVPVVLDSDVAARHQEIGLVDDLAFVIEDRGAQEQPVGVLAARSERPDSIEHIAALGRLGLPRGDDHRRDDSVGVGAEGFFLRGLWEMRHQPAMRVDDAHAPRRRAAAERDRRDRVDVRAQRLLMTAIPASLQDPEETRLAQCLDIGRRYFTQLFSLGHAPAQFRNERGCTRHKIIMSKRLVCNARGYRAFTLRGGDGHGGSSCCS